MIWKWKGGLLYLVILLTIMSCQKASATIPEAAEPAQPEATILLEGLLNPVGVEPLPNGGLLVAEEGSGEDDLSSGITLLLPSGEHGRLISNIPSSRDSGDLSGAPFVKWRDGILYTSHFNLGYLATLPLDLDALDLPDTPYTIADMGQTMKPLNAVQLRNPFDMTFDEDGTAVVSDATENGVAIQTENGTTRFFHRFAPLENPDEGKRFIDAVPTGIWSDGDEFLLTLTTGCPYPQTGGQLVAIDRERNQRTLVDGLSMPIDVVRDEAGSLWLLEFARFEPGGDCFSGQGYQPHSGRLSRVEADGTVTPVLTELNFPAGMAFDSNGRLLISELFAGRVVQISHVDGIETAVSLPTLLGESVESDASASEPTADNGFPMQFVNVASEVGLNFQHGAFTLAISKDPVAMMGAGLCWIDYDRDGWLDLYLVNSHSLAERPYWQTKESPPHNQLFRNVDGRFTDVSQASQSDLVLRGNGCVAADFDNDGWTDLYITADGPNALLWNQGDGTFREGAEAAGVAAPEWNASSAVGDLNGDGWLDLFVTAYIDLDNKIEKPVGAFPQDFYGLPDRFYLNNGDGTFSEVTQQVGLLREERGLGATLSDLDGDRNLDLYIANDGHPNRLYLSQQDDSALGFTLEDVSQSAATNDSGSGMGIATGDYDGDGRFDLFVTNWDTELNALYRNQIDDLDSLTFRYSTHRIGISGLGNEKTGWGTAWADFDNDSDSDLLVVNGHVPITDLAADAQLVRIYSNLLAEGEPGQMRDWTTLVGVGQEALGPLTARGSAVADFDNDGDLDIAINQIGGPMVLLENRSQPQNWLGVGFETVMPGTAVTLTTLNGQQQLQEIRIGSSYLASEDPRLHFGLGAYEGEVSLEIVSIDGRVLTLDNITPNQYLHIGDEQLTQAAEGTP